MVEFWDIVSLIVVCVLSAILGIVWGVVLGMYVPRIKKRKIEKRAVESIEKMKRDGYSYRHREDLGKEGIIIDLDKEVKQAIEQNDIKNNN